MSNERFACSRPRGTNRIAIVPFRFLPEAFDELLVLHPPKDLLDDTERQREPIAGGFGGDVWKSADKAQGEIVDDSRRYA